MNIKVIFQYRFDAIIGSISTLLMQISVLIFLDAIFNNVKECGGWNYNEVLLMYGMFTVCRGLNHVFFDNLWIIGREFIRKGTFDIFLVRPANELFLLLSQKVQPDGLGTLILGIVIFNKALGNLKLKVTLPNVLVFIFIFIMGTCIIATINWIFSVSSFWVVKSHNIIWTVFSVADFAQYPLEIFSPAIRFILTKFIPYGFVSYYPACYLLGKASSIVLIQELGVLLALAVIGHCLWKIGLKRYESSGN